MKITHAHSRLERPSNSAQCLSSVCKLALPPTAADMALVEVERAQENQLSPDAEGGEPQLKLATITRWRSMRPGKVTWTQEKVDS